MAVLKVTVSVVCRNQNIVAFNSTIWVNHSISEPIYLQKIRPTKAVRPGADRKRAQGITSVRVIGNFEPLDYQCSRKAISRFNWLQQQKSDGSSYSEGHCGEKVELKTQAEKDNHKQMLARFGWSITNSDKIPLDRLPPDLRMPECKEIDYPPNLPKAIVIFVFHNEAWTTLMRSVHTVIRQTPRQLITHILLVDDGSTRQHLGHLLEEYIEANWPEGFVILHPIRRFTLNENDFPIVSFSVGVSFTNMTTIPKFIMNVLLCLSVP